MKDSEEDDAKNRMNGFLNPWAGFFYGSSCGLVSFYFHATSHLPADSGGIIGDLLGSGFHAF